MSKVLVIGMGKSGKAAYRFLQEKGDEPAGVDSNPEAVAKLQQEGFDAALERDASSFDWVVVSPGVSPSDKHYTAALKNGKEVVGEAELAFRHARQPCVAITGTNGKTTVTLLVEHVLKENGKKAKALGNVGEPLTAYFINPDPAEIVVAEVSSYQLETMRSRVFDAAVILNITPDHLDRYGSMEEYAKAKCRLQQCLKSGSPLYVNVQMLKEFGHLLEDNYRTFGRGSGAWLWTDKSVIKEVDKVEVRLPEEYEHLGIHESENALAAYAICKQFGISPEGFVRSLSTFRKPAHRIEFIASIGGVSYYDDSKGTNIDAAIQAVGSMSGPVVLIAGGVDKGASYAPWITSFSGKVKEIIAIGQAAEKIASQLKNSLPVTIWPTLEKAVARAKEIAAPGDAVLLSPGCSSFDMFRDYAHRGEVFKEAVEKLTG